MTTPLVYDLVHRLYYCVYVCVNIVMRVNRVLTDGTLAQVAEQG